MIDFSSRLVGEHKYNKSQSYKLISKHFIDSTSY